MSRELDQISTSLTEKDIARLDTCVEKLKDENPSMTITRSQVVAAAIDFFMEWDPDKRLYWICEYQKKRKRERA